MSSNSAHASKTPMSSRDVIEKLIKPEDVPFLKSISLQPSDSSHRIEVFVGVHER